MIIGIDLGTTYSLGCVLQAGKPVLIPNSLGELLTPSAVSVGDDGTVFVGAAAKARAATHPDVTALSFKRDMGTGRLLRLGEESFTPQALSALVLRALKADAEGMLGRPVTEAVITVPAYFGDLQRTATKEAAAIAGLHVDRIVNEPTAAALAYGLTERSRELTAIVLDLGGGTFDVTVLQIMEGVIEIRSSAGDARLGGDDFDSALMERLARTFRGIDAARLRVACEDAKRRLSSADKARVVLPDLLDVELTRADAEDAWRPLLERMRGPIERALGDAGIEEVDEVLLVGGATRMPCVRALAARMFGKLPLQHLPPDEAVAMGAAVQAALKANDASVDDLVVTDVAPFSLGIETGATLGMHVVSGMFTPIIERGTVIPCSRVERFAPLREKQRQLDVTVYQGEHAECAKNQLLGCYKLMLQRGSADPSVDVRFTYDLNGILEVEMTHIATGKREAFVLEQRPGAMSAAAMAQAREQMQRLKTDPRDKLPNSVALARADALYAELTGDERHFLSQAILAFRGALASQNERAIAQVREELTALVARLRR